MNWTKVRAEYRATITGAKCIIIEEGDGNFWWRANDAYGEFIDQGKGLRSLGDAKYAVERAIDEYRVEMQQKNWVRDTKKFSGELSVQSSGEADDIIHLDGNPLAEVLEVLKGSIVTVRYYISTEQRSEEELIEMTVRYYHGLADVDFRHRYSEITGYLWTNEDMIIGGHDLKNELYTDALQGRYLLLLADIHGGLTE